MSQKQQLQPTRNLNDFEPVSAILARHGLLSTYPDPETASQEEVNAWENA